MGAVASPTTWTRTLTLGLAEFDLLDPEQGRRLRLIRLYFGDERLRPLALEEELEGSLSLRIDDAEDEHGALTELRRRDGPVSETTRWRVDLVRRGDDPSYDKRRKRVGA